MNWMPEVEAIMNWAELADNRNYPPARYEPA